MQRTLEDEENYENISVDINPNIDNGNRIDSIHQSKEANGSQCSGSMKAADSSTSTKTRGENQVETLNEEASVTEKHDCDARNQETCEETQEAEFTSGEPSAKGAFGSDIDAGHTAPIGTEQILGTEQIMETETQGHDQNVDLNKLVGDTMVIDDDDEEEEEGVKVDNGENLHQSKDPIEEDTEAGDPIRTADLLASEVIGSWACSTAPSCHGDNESLGSGGFDKGNRGSAGGGGGVLQDSACIAAESQTGGGRNLEHEALTTMIGIVAPEMKGQFGGTIESDSDKAVASNSDTEDCTEDEDGESDAEIQGRHSPSHNDNNVVELMDEDDDDGDQEETQPDSP